jgi:hypothetical protein
MIYTGMPSPDQMPQQQMMLPPSPAPSEMVIDVLGVRVPVTMLENGYFWALLMVAAVVVLGVAYFKYARRGLDHGVGHPSDSCPRWKHLTHAGQGSLGLRQLF